MSATSTPWQAAADVFVVTASTRALTDALEQACAELSLTSPDPRTRFHAESRSRGTSTGAVVVVTDIAVYDTGARRPAVTVSATIDKGADETTVSIHTLVDPRHTAHDDGVIVFAQHHDAIRSALNDAVRAVDPDAHHRSRPAPPARRRTAATLDDVPDERIPLRQVAGIALLAVGVLVLLAAIAVGELPLIVLGLAIAAALGYTGNRIAGN